MTRSAGFCDFFGSSDCGFCLNFWPLSDCCIGHLDMLKLWATGMVWSRWDGRDGVMVPRRWFTLRVFGLFFLLYSCSNISISYFYSISIQALTISMQSVATFIKVALLSVDSISSLIIKCSCYNHSPKTLDTLLHLTPLVGTTPSCSQNAMEWLSTCFLHEFVLEIDNNYCSTCWYLHGLIVVYQSS